MKELLTLVVLPLFVACSSCNKDDDDNDGNGGSQSEFIADSYAKVSAWGEVKVYFNQPTSKKSTSGDFTVKINVSQEQLNDIAIVSEIVL
jgi:hypothetical protein